MNKKMLLFSAIPITIFIVVGVWYSAFAPKQKEFVSMGEVNVDLVSVNVMLWHYEDYGNPHHSEDNLPYIPPNFLDVWRNTYRNLSIKYLNYSVDNESLISLKYKVLDPEWWGDDPYFGGYQYSDHFIINLNITHIYVEKIMFFTDVSKFNVSRGWLIHIGGGAYTEHEEQWKHTYSENGLADSERCPFAYDKVYINSTGLNYTEEFYTDIDRGGWDEPPIKIVVYVETTEKIYYATFYIKFIRVPYPLYNCAHNPINATYYCFNNTTKSVVISDRIVYGTDYYFFVNEDGKMSWIKEVKENE